MKQVLIKRGQITVEDVPAPLVEPGHVLVEVAFSLISSGTELSAVEASGRSLIKRALEQPGKIKLLVNHFNQHGIKRTLGRVKERLEEARPVGYSCSGVAIQVGYGVEGIFPGDLVACAGAGIANHAEIVLVPRNLVARVPDGCNLRAAASVALGAIAMQGVRRANPQLGEVIAVIGLGLLGQLTVQLLKIAGCRVIGLDLDARRVEIAHKLGADEAFVSTEADVFMEVLHLTEGHGVDATIITAASKSDAIVQQAMEITRKKGRVIVVGDVGLRPKRSPFYEKEIDFLISCSYGPGRYDERYEEKGMDYPYAYVRWTENRNMQEYLRLLAEGKVRLESILEREYSITEAPQAYEELQTAPEKPLGVLLRYPAGDHLERSNKLATKVVIRSSPISDKINIAVVGAGNFAKFMHLPNLRRLSSLYHIRAIVSATGSNAKIVAKQFGADYATTNYEDVLSDPNINAVLICTRHNLHAQQVIAAIKAGKHVYCEKPLALNERELGDILACYGLYLADFKDNRPQIDTQGLGPILTVGFNRRFSPAAIRAKEILKHRVTPLVIVYRVNAGYVPVSSWVHGEEGGGRIIGEACHMIDLFSYFTENRVESIDVSFTSPKTEHILNSDNFAVTLKYIDGSVCSLIYTSLGADAVAKEYVEIHCDGKTLIIDDFKELRVYGCKIGGWKGFQDKGHLRALEEFSLSIRRGKTWPISLEELVEVTLITFIVKQLAK
ncbi:MAG: bi-domain-containing oxidoreductase [Candidatus Bathyarchaeia archaeon]